MCNYDDWKLDSGQDSEKVVCMCDNCKGEIYEGEHIYKGDDFIVHEDCFYEYSLCELNAKSKIAKRSEE